MNNKKIQDNVFYRDRNKIYPLIEKGEGIYLYAKDGKRYIDATGGPMVVSIGHGVDEIIDAMVEQAKKVCFAYTGTFSTAPQLDLARKVIEYAPKGMSHVYFVSGGSEAIEYAMETARQYFLANGEVNRTRMIGRWQSYHGATFGTLSVGGHTVFRKDYAPYLMDFPHIPPPYCYRCPYGLDYPSCGVYCAHYLEQLIQYEGKENIAAFVVEPVSGSSLGAVTPPPEYFPIIRDICDRYGLLLIVDEVITGFGRTGLNFAVDHWNVIPDIIVTAKGMSSGYTPLGGIIIHDKLFAMLDSSGKARFFSGFTFAGNALSCAVGLAVLSYIQKNGLVERAAKMSRYLFEQAARLKKMPVVGDIRGLGMLLGIELVRVKEEKLPFQASKRISDAVVQKAFEKGLVVRGGHGFINGEEGDLIIIAPPFTVRKEEIDEILNILEESITAVCQPLIFNE